MYYIYIYVYIYIYLYTLHYIYLYTLHIHITGHNTLTLRDPCHSKHSNLTEA